MIPVGEIRDAAERIRGRAVRTPLLRVPENETGLDLFLKCECFQRTGSFKTRGALNKILTLSPGERRRGLITVSAGNHAQAVAWAAREVGAPCAVVMPGDAPRIKLEAVRRYGAEPILHPDRAGLFDRLHAEMEERGSVFVHPFDDPVVVAGAGTAGLEIQEDAPSLDGVVVPVGGGGLLSGVVSAVRQIRPGVAVTAVELEEGPGLAPALDAGKPVPVPRPWKTVADGMIPPFVGRLALEIARTEVESILGVTEREIEAAMRWLATEARLLVEGSGAAAVAAILSGKTAYPRGSRVAVLVSGGNADPAVLARILGEETPTPGIS